MPTPENVLNYYYRVPHWQRGKQMQWVLSTDTVEAIAAACGLPSSPPPDTDDDSEWMLAAPMLLGCPIRIDESAEGLNHDFIDGSPIWVHRDKAAHL